MSVIEHRRRSCGTASSLDAQTMTSSDLSSCCKSSVRVEGGMPEDQGEGVTQFMICEKCGQECGIINPEDWREDR